MEGEDNQGDGKRVSFLMPYIDFCFMLIIIFVGMLSIAYFEPLGAFDYEVKNDNTVDNEEGNFDRIVAFELALVQAITMDPIYGRVTRTNDPRVASMNRKVNSPMFLPQRNIFKRNRRKLFV